MRTPSPSEAVEALNAVNTLIDYFENKAKLTGPLMNMVKTQLLSIHTGVYQLSEVQKIAEDMVYKLSEIEKIAEDMVKEKTTTAESFYDI